MVAILEPITDVIYTMIHNITLHHTMCHISLGYLAVVEMATTLRKKSIDTLFF